MAQWRAAVQCCLWCQGRHITPLQVARLDFIARKHWPPRALPSLLCGAACLLQTSSRLASLPSSSVPLPQQPCYGLQHMLPKHLLAAAGGAAATHSTSTRTQPAAPAVPPMSPTYLQIPPARLSPAPCKRSLAGCDTPPPALLPALPLLQIRWRCLGNIWGGYWRRWG
jgi:hypothetical protein